MAETATITAPVVETAPAAVVPPIVPNAPAVETPAVNLIDKVAQFKKTQIATKPAEGQTFFDYKEIDKITDPVAKKFAEDAYKSMQSGFTKKTQEIAEQKRSYEQKIVEMQNWSPERIQRELLNNPQFLQAAQQIAGNQNQPNSGLTDEQFSALTPQEKGQIDALRSKINTLEQSNFQATVAQRDSQLQTKYPDYNPSQIDLTIRNLAQMNPLDIREHVYKSLKHDEDVAAAYELGKSERESLNQTKINAIGPTGTTVLSSTDKPVREKGETDQAYFMKLTLHNLAQFKNRK